MNETAVAGRQNAVRQGNLRLVWWVAFWVFVIDQISKIWVVHVLDLATRLKIEVWPPFLNFHMAWNYGINFGLLAGEAPATRWILISVALGIVQAVHACDGLDEGVLLQRLVDVEHSVARFVESGEQSIHHDEQVRRAIACEFAQHTRLVGIGVAAHVRVPPRPQLGQLARVNVGIALAVAGRGHDDGAAHQARGVQAAVVADGVELAGRGHLECLGFPS